MLVRFRYHLPTVPASACSVSYEVFGDGTVRTTLDYEAVKGLPEMPEFGMLFRLDADLDRVAWYGLGPEETYADRRHGGHVVNFSLTHGVMRICRAREFQIVLPDVLDELDLDRDWSDDMRKAEAER